VSTSASWEKSRKEGGTIQAVKEAIMDSLEDQVPIYDLDSGVIESWRSLEDFETPGEYIFWKALEHVLRLKPPELRVAFLTLVKEPGKARSVTKARTMLKIVLDVINKVCAWPLKKGIRSSQSGMGQSHHGWNFFLRQYSEEMKADLFSIMEREEDVYEGYVERTDTFADLFMSSTDYEEATDRMSHEFAAMSAEAWMTKCGIPPMLKGIVHATCFRPRIIVFRGTGPLADHGMPVDGYGDNARAIVLKVGVLMGDPLTKICLHFSNIVSRSIGENISNLSFYRGDSNADAAITAYLDGLYSEDVQIAL